MRDFFYVKFIKYSLTGFALKCIIIKKGGDKDEI